MSRLFSYEFTFKAKKNSFSVIMYSWSWLMCDVECISFYSRELSRAHVHFLPYYKGRLPNKYLFLFSSLFRERRKARELLEKRIAHAAIRERGLWLISWNVYKILFVRLIHARAQHTHTSSCAVRGASYRIKKMIMCESSPRTHRKLSFWDKSWRQRRRKIN